MARDEVDMQSSFGNTSITSEKRTLISKDQRGNVEQPISRDRIKFRVEYVSVDNTVLYENETPGPHYEHESSNSSERPVFEIVTTFLTGKKTFTKGESLASRTAPSRCMHIHSVAIIHALRSVVQYYPSQDLASDNVKINAPYPVLVHHYDELMEYRQKFKPGGDKELCYREKDAHEHLGILKDFLDEHIMPAVIEERERNKRGYSTFDMQWIGLKPGNPFVGFLVDEAKHYAGVLHSYTGGSFESPPASWTINFWTMEYNGSSIGRVANHVRQGKYDGEIHTTLRPVDLNSEPLEEAVQNLIDEGEIYWRLLRKQCKYYKGKTITFPHNEVDGLVMADLDAYYAERQHALPVLLDSTADRRAWISDCTCLVCSRRRGNNKEKPAEIFEIMELIYPKVTTELTNHAYLLLPKSISAYVFRTRSWERLHVRGFSDPVFDEDMIEHLVMDEKRVQMLKALAKSFVRLNQFGEMSERSSWSADFVKGKGNGLIFLLHGRSGVGKTCTAECIAAFTGRPLMVLTNSEIGTNPKEVEANLTNHFKRARSWGAVLLIDEADVFMERRTTADLNRNSLVAGFLHALEFYDGILFLTTNRVGSFDDAFMSRIHFQLYYPDFDDEGRRKIWQTFIDKLRRERGDYIRLNIDAKEYLDGKELKAVKWNGREIRNAFQTAVALAEYEATKDEEGKIVLTDKHLKSVVEMSRDFKEYLNELHVGDEGKRAERRRERLDKHPVSKASDFE